MKLLKLSMIVFAAIAMTFTSCQKEVDQASPVVIDMSKKASISGYLKAVLEVDTLGASVSSPIPSGTKITVVVSGDDLSYNEPGVKDFIYETTTNQAGYYQINVPTTPSGVNVTINFNDFKFDQVYYERDNNNKWVTKDRMKIYALGAKADFLIEADKVIFEDNYSIK